MAKTEQEYRYPVKQVRFMRERPRLVLHTGSETPTQQHFKDECDINKLMAKYKATGLIPQTVKPPFYGDFTDIPDYQKALKVVMDAQELFSHLSSDVRKRFHNDPAEFLEFCSKPENGDELLKMGLRNPPQSEPDPVRVEIVNPAPVEDPK